MGTSSGKGKFIGDAFNSFNPVSAVVGGGLNFLGQNIQNNHNVNMMREQMKFHRQEREASQAFQTSEREAQQAYQTGERNAQNIWQESMYGKYQSPEAMVRQYNEAGINGRLAASGQAGMGSMSVSGGSNGGAPSSGAPSGSHVNPPYQNISAASAGFESISKSLLTLSETKKNGIETKYLEDRLKEDLKQSRITSALMDIEFDVQKLTALPMAKAAVDKLMAEAKKENLNLAVINKQLEILENERIITKADADTAKERIQAEVNKLIAEKYELDKRAEVHVGEKFLKEQQGKTEAFKRSEIVQNIKESNSRIENIDADTLYKKALNVTERTKPALNKALTRSHSVLAELSDLQVRLKRSTFGKERASLAAEYDKKLKELQKDIILLTGELDDLKGPRTLDEIRSVNDFFDYLARGYIEARAFNSEGPLY